MWLMGEVASLTTDSPFQRKINALPKGDNVVWIFIIFSIHCGLWINPNLNPRLIQSYSILQWPLHCQPSALKKRKICIRIRSSMPHWSVIFYMDLCSVLQTDRIMPVKLQLFILKGEGRHKLPEDTSLNVPFSLQLLFPELLHQYNQQLKWFVWSQSAAKSFSPLHFLCYWSC